MLSCLLIFSLYLSLRDCEQVYIFILWPCCLALLLNSPVPLGFNLASGATWKCKSNSSCKMVPLSLLSMLIAFDSPFPKQRGVCQVV